jgi:hypothetical protein
VKENILEVEKTPGELGAEFETMQAEGEFDERLLPG